MRISDWSSDVCSSDLPVVQQEREGQAVRPAGDGRGHCGARLERRQRRHGGGELRRLYRHCGEAGWTSAVAGEGGGADRKRVVEGKSVSVRVDLGGRRIIKKKNQETHVHN